VVEQTGDKPDEIRQGAKCLDWWQFTPKLDRWEQQKYGTHCRSPELCDHCRSLRIPALKFSNCLITAADVEKALRIESQKIEGCLESLSRARRNQAKWLKSHFPYG